ncbi:hypothetical protein [Xanthobacter sp. ZOL 2024]
MAPRKEIHEQVLAQVIEVIKQARANGEPEMAVVARTFPGMPDAIYWAAYCDLDNAEIDAWWEAVEKTIDGEIIRNALSKIT